VEVSGFSNVGYDLPGDSDRVGEALGEEVVEVERGVDLEGCECCAYVDAPGEGGWGKDFELIWVVFSAGIGN
jgi:hypothetical protein